MYCSKCWMSNPDDALFCSNCGTPFSTSGASTPVTRTPTQIAVNQPMEYTGSDYQTSSKQSQEPIPPYTSTNRDSNTEEARVQQNVNPATESLLAPTKQDNSFLVLMWIIALIISSRAFYVLFKTYYNSETAIQQAAGAAFAAGMAVIPYCIVRAISEIKRLK